MPGFRVERFPLKINYLGLLMFESMRQSNYYRSYKQRPGISLSRNQLEKFYEQKKKKKQMAMED